MTNEEKLLRAIGEIDDEIIRDASSSYKRSFTPLTRGLTVAASILIVSAVVILSGNLFSEKSFDNSFAPESGGDACPPPDNNSPAPTNYAYADTSDVLSSSVGLIYDIKTLGEYKVQFTLTLYEDAYAPLDVSVFGTNEKNGLDGICTNSKDDLSGYDVSLPIKLTVNGEEAEALPRTAGDYTVTIDYSVITTTDGYRWYADIIISGFGSIKFK